MALAQRLTNTGVLQTPGTFDEYTNSANYYSVQFNGSTQWLTVPTNAAFAFGTGDFTIELWLYNRSNGQSTLFDFRATTSSASPYVFKTGSNTISYNTAGAGTVITGTKTLALNTWHHIALVKSSNVTRLYVNGTQDGSSYSDTNTYVNTTVVLIANSFQLTSPVNGYISNFRIVKGTAVYTSNFIRPFQPLTAITGTSLLTCKSATIVDTGTANGGSPFTITNVGTATVSNSVVPTYNPVARLFNDGTLQVSNTFDEVTLRTDAIAVYPSTISGQSLSYSGTPGTFTWICPVGVTSVNVVCVGGGGRGGYNGGGGAGGGALAYINNYTVVPGTSYTVVTGVGGSYDNYILTGSEDGGTSYFNNTSTVAAGGGKHGGMYSNPFGGAGGTVLAGTGFAGGAGGKGVGSYQSGGGGGAGGYTAVGGTGGIVNGTGPSSLTYVDGTSSTGGGGGGGGYGQAGGGGVGLYGLGSNGVGGGASVAGTGGSGGGSGGTGWGTDTGGTYGGGAGGANGGPGGVGAVRIYWGGTALPTIPASASARRLTPSSYQVLDSFDELTLAYTITSNKSLVNEGDAVTYTINAPLADVSAYSVRINPNAYAQEAGIKTSGGNGAVLNARSNNWTIEFWFKTSTYYDTQGRNSQYLFDCYSGSNLAFIGSFDSFGSNFSFYDGTNNQSGALNSPYPLNQWNHFALVCNTTLSLYINGVVQSGWDAVTNNIVSNSYTTNINQFNISSLTLGVGVSDLYFSQFRINNSTSAYTGNFTPPNRLLATQGSSTNINTITNGTMLLTCNSLYFVDQSTNAFTLSPFALNIPMPVITTDAPPLSGSNFGSGILYWTNSGSTAAADFTGGIVYGVTPLTWAGTATATLWSFKGITQLSTSGIGTGAVFSIRKNNATTTMGTYGVLTVIPTSPGSGYTIGDTIVIDGASLGLTTTTNNLTITVGSDWFSQLVYSATITGTGMVTSGTGTANWTCPDGVYRISVVAVGGGGGGGSGANPGGGGGGGLAYVTDIAVVPNTVYAVTAGIGGAATVAGGNSSFGSVLTATGGNQGVTGGGGGGGGYNALGSGSTGGVGGNSAILGGGGGGAGGYTSDGGAGGISTGASPNLVARSGGNSIGGGGGGGSTGGGAGGLNTDGSINNSTTGNGGGGGGTGLLGSSNMGNGGVLLAGTTGAILGQSGYGGSGGSQGGAASATVGGAGAIYGGGGGGGTTTGGAGGAGAVRIIWNYPHGFLPSTTALTVSTGITLVSIPFTNTYGAIFNGTTSDIGLVDTGSSYNLSSSDFTIEGFVCPISTSINRSIVSKRATSTSIAWISFGTSTTTPGYFGLRVANATGSAWTIQDETAASVYIGNWYHFAITKTNGYVNLYINGVLAKQYAHNTEIYDDNTSMLDFGRSANDNSGNNWSGIMSNIRFTPGIAIYTSNFTVPTAALSTYGTLKKTVALVAQSATAKDNSGVGNGGSFTLVTYGNSIIPFSNTYSGYFNGTSASISLYSYASSTVDLGSSDFTIEGFVYPTDTTLNRSIINKRATSTSISWVAFGTSATTSGYFGLRVANATGSAWTIQDETAAAFSINTWYHFAITKTNGYVYLYINGVLAKQYTHNTAIYDNTNSNINFGRPSDNNSGVYWLGYMSNMRVTTNLAIYTSNFTTPTTALSSIKIGTTVLLAQSATNIDTSGYLSILGTSPQTLGGVTFYNSLTASTETKLLTAQSSTIVDESGTNSITNVGSVTAGSVTIPFASTYSYQFNGTTQYLTITSASGTDFTFGAGIDFTIEGYLYTSATTINKGLIYKRTGSGISGVNFGTSTTTASRFQLRVANADGSAWTINDATAGTFAINTWYHFAITKTNGYVYLYINGLMVRRYAHTTAIYDDGSDLTIGRDPGGSFWVGYLSNIRITNGVALYYPPSTIVNRNYPDYPYVVQNSGSVPISAGSGILTLPISEDVTQEGVQDLRLSLRSGSTSGTVLATAPTVLIADTSRPLALPGGNQCWCAYPDYVSGPNLVYTGTPGVFTFTAPKGYTTVSAVAIGGGGSGGVGGSGGGGGGALAYSASIPVTAGTTYTITCGAGGVNLNAGSASSFASTVIANGGQSGGTYPPSSAGGAGGTVGAGTGFAGGAGGAVSAGGAGYAGGGGGGAGGYTAAGGVGGAVTGTYPTLTAASGVGSATGGAGGGAGGSTTAGAYFAAGGGGGGTSPFGSVAVASAAGIAYAGLQGSPGRGGGGSGGNPTTTASGVQLGQNGYTATGYNNTLPIQKPNGGRFGGGGGGGDNQDYFAGDGGPGCVRIIWGTGRAYPATLTADRVSGYPAGVGNPAGQQ